MRYLLLFGALAVGCGNTVVEEGTTAGTGGGTGGTTTSSVTTGGAGGGTAGGGGVAGGGTAGGGGVAPCGGSPDNDMDGDGFSPAQGDCDDCDPDVGPAAAEMPTFQPDPDQPSVEPVDDDCDGLVDEPPDVCDGALALDSEDPLDAARALDMCSFLSEGAYHGVVSATYRLPDLLAPPAGQIAAFHKGHGLLPDLGPNAPAQRGSRLLALSSATARRPTDPEYAQYFDKKYTSNHPPGLPFNGPCSDFTTGQPHDGIMLEVELKPPVNATALLFRFRFYTGGFEKDTCTEYNDHFAVLMSPAPPGLGSGNIAYDQSFNPLTVSWLFPEACSCPDSVGCLGDPPCAAKAALLQGSGFEGVYGAASQWLNTVAPLEEGTGSLTLRFLVYDAGDGIVDTTTIVDAFEWIDKKAMTVKTPPEE